MGIDGNILGTLNFTNLLIYFYQNHILNTKILAQPVIYLYCYNLLRLTLKKISGMEKPKHSFCSADNH